MYICQPYNQLGIFAPQRLALSHRAECKACGQKVGAPRLGSGLAAFPLMLTLLSPPCAPTLTFSLAMLICAAGAMFVLRFKFAPLIER